MQTDKIVIDSKGRGREAALQEAEKFAAYNGLDRKGTLRLRLLAEEALGMLGAITDRFQGEFWMESASGNVCKLHMMIKTEMDYEKRKELIDASTNKKNAAYVGIMGKIREFIEASAYADATQRDESWQDVNRLEFFTMGMLDAQAAPGSPINTGGYVWSMDQYKTSVRKEKNEDAWDELEKSIIANLADEVRVSVKGNKAELVIEKSL